MVKKVILKGTYCLIIHVSSDIAVEVGNVGFF